METKTWFDIDPRSYKKPTVVRFRTKTPRFSWQGRPEVLYAVCGTEYGYLHNSAGELRTWKSYSGAYRAAKKYISV